MNDPNERFKLSTEQKALAALVATGTINKAAKQSGLPASTIVNFLNDEGFKVKLHNAKKNIVADAVDKTMCLVGRSIDVLEELMETGDPSMRLKAAIQIQTLVFSRLENIYQMEGRLKDVERKFNEAAGNVRAIATESEDGESEE